MILTVANVTSEVTPEDTDKGLRQFIAVITWLIILFVPVYSKTYTELRIYGPITEKTYFWPWMILTFYTPRDEYNANQIDVVNFPWSLILFIPSFYAFKAAWMLFKSNEDRIIHSGQIVIASIIQYFIIFVASKSQDSGTPETATIYFFPQILLIAIHGILSVNWFISEFDKSKKNRNVS